VSPSHRKQVKIDEVDSVVVKQIHISLRGYLRKALRNISFADTLNTSVLLNRDVRFPVKSYYDDFRNQKTRQGPLKAPSFSLPRFDRRIC
jgi:hypothetical protein